MVNNFNNSLVLIRNSENQSFGTGFVVLKEKNYSYIITCSHVVENTPKTLFVDSTEAKILYQGSSDGLDLAILKAKIDKEPLSLLESDCNDFEIIGFKNFEKNNHILEPISCTLDTKVELRPQSEEKVSAWKLNIDESDIIMGGYSGSPLICKESKKVVAVISNRKGGRDGFAISIEHIKDIWKDMPHGLLIEKKETSLKKELSMKSMSSYIAIHNFVPNKRYPNEEQVIELINNALENHIQEFKKLNSDYDENEEYNADKLDKTREQVQKCLREYNRLVGINQDVLDNHIENPPVGLLPQYVEAILGYFINSLENNKEIKILEDSGIKEIKIRYKHADSVIKKLVKIGLDYPEKLENSLNIFLNGGALHDLIGIQFICAYPYQSEWLARSLYNFFHIPNRTDDHLLHGFYRVDRESGYKGLHCDKTYWNSAFDRDFMNNQHSAVSVLEIDKVLDNKKNQFIDVENDNIDKRVYLLSKYNKVFNIEIQIHTSFQSIWAKMEHEKSYNILAKGGAKNKEITVLWKILSDNLTNIENQFQKLQVQTEQSIFQDDKKDGYGFISEILVRDKETLDVFNQSVLTTRKLKDKLLVHEIAREDYVMKLMEERQRLEKYIQVNPKLYASAVFSIRLQIAFIYYSFSNHRKYFNIKDIGSFVETCVKDYNEIFDGLSHNPEHKSIEFKELMIITSVIRYGRLTQKYGLGLIDKELLAESDIPMDINNQNTKQDKGLQYLGYGLYYFIEISAIDLNVLKNDSASFYRTIHYFDRLVRDVELSNATSTLIKGIRGRHQDIPLSDLIKGFRKKYMEGESGRILCQNFMDLLSGDAKEERLKDTSFIIGFLSTLVINKLARPIDILGKVIKLSSHDNIKASDIFLYEYAAYTFLYVYECEEISDCDREDKEHICKEKTEHYGLYHYENMINLLFRIKKEEDIYEFLKAKTYFNALGRDFFKEDYLYQKCKKRLEVLS